MQIHVIAVGKIRERYLRDAIAEYEKRLRPYVNLKVVEVTEKKRPVPVSGSAEILAKEDDGERILAEIPQQSLIIALDIRGQDWTSIALAEALSHWEMAGRNRVAFLIGGDLGLSPPLLSKSDLRLSLSPMTFTHQMARLILLEQIYRAFRIIHGEPYHK